MSGAALLRYLTLPFTLTPLLLVAIFSTLLQLTLQAGVFGLALFCIIGSWFLKYAFVLLEHAAQGRPGAPVFAMEDANPLGEKRPLLFGVIIVIAYGVTSMVGALLGDGWAAALRIAGMVALPAVIAVQAVTGSYVEALNPRAVVDMARRLGTAYFVVMGVAAACALLVQWLVVGDAGHLALLSRIACTMLLWLVLFALLGGVIYERRFEIGYEPEHSPERTAHRDSVALGKERDKFVDQVFAEYRAGSSRNAWETIRRRAGDGAPAIAEYEWILERVSRWPAQGLALRVAQEQLGLLLAHQRNGAALQLVRARVQADPQFRPTLGEHALRLAQLARDGGDWPLARLLLSDFEQRFPDHPARGSVALLLEQLHKR